ncbi:MAG: zinc ribbon domain-containing protein [Promethearchaeota archaeon]
MGMRRRRVARGIARRTTRRVVRRAATRPFRAARRASTRRRIRRRRRRLARRVVLGSSILFGLAGSTLAYRLSRRDAARIEESAGKPLEELSEDELHETMDAEGIERREITDDEQAKLDEIDQQEGNFFDERYCPYCGVSLEEEARFCSACGKEL